MDDALLEGRLLLIVNDGWSVENKENGKIPTNGDCPEPAGPVAKDILKKDCLLLPRSTLGDDFLPPPLQEQVTSA